MWPRTRRDAARTTGLGRAAAAHTAARRAGARRSARVLAPVGFRPPRDLTLRKVALGRAIIAGGLALLAAATVLFATALLLSRWLG